MNNIIEKIDTYLDSKQQNEVAVMDPIKRQKIDMLKSQIAKAKHLAQFTLQASKMKKLPKNQREEDRKKSEQYYKQWRELVDELKRLIG